MLTASPTRPREAYAKLGHAARRRGCFQQSAHHPPVDMKRPAMKPKAEGDGGHGGRRDEEGWKRKDWRKERRSMCEWLLMRLMAQVFTWS